MVKINVGITLVILIVLIGGFLLFYYKPESSSISGQTVSLDSEQSNSDNEKSDEDKTISLIENSQETKEFNVIAKKWEFSPNPITVNQGDKVILNIKSIDVTHGFVLPEFGVNERLSSGNEIKVEFIADKKGTFSFFCNVYCGAGHSDMKGTLIVQ